MPSTGATSLVLSSFACRSATVASASATLASARARSSAVGPARAAQAARLQREVGLAPWPASVAFVELLAAGEVAGRQRSRRAPAAGRRARDWPRRIDGLVEDRDLLGAHAGIDARTLAAALRPPPRPRRGRRRARDCRASPGDRPCDPLPRLHVDRGAAGRRSRARCGSPSAAPCRRSAVRMMPRQVDSRPAMAAAASASTMTS